MAFINPHPIKKVKYKVTWIGKNGHEDGYTYYHPDAAKLRKEIEEGNGMSDVKVTVIKP